MELSLANLRVLREIADRGSFTAAAAELGYTQSAVSRQAAAAERATGMTLFDRRPGGIRLTPAGRTMLRHAVVALDAIAAAERELKGLPSERGTLRLGMFPSAGTLVVPRALAALRRTHPDIAVRTREGSTPALVRALRARTLDLALLASKAPHRPPDDELPRLELETLAETTLLVAVPASSTLATRSVVDVTELCDQEWIAGPSSSNEPMLGAWPGLPGRPRVSHTARDWLTKLHLVAAGCGVTTVPASFSDAVPAGVRLVEVRGGPPQQRRLVLARLPGSRSHATTRLVHVLRHEAGRHGA